MKSIKFYIISFSVSFLVCFSSIQKILAITTVNEKQFKNLSVKDGLSHSNVFQILQDSTGLMWFSTRSGMDSYDGINFRQYYLKSERIVSSDQNVPRSAIIDRRGVLWVGTQSGLFRFNPMLDRFEDVIFSRNAETSDLSIFSILDDQNDVFYIGSGNAIHEFHLCCDSIQNIASFSGAVRQVLRISDSGLLAIIRDGLFLINTVDYTVTDLTEYFLKQTNIRTSSELHLISLFKDSTGRVWVSSNNHGVLLFDEKMQFLFQLKSMDYIASTNAKILKVLEISPYEYVLAVSLDGLVFLNGNLEITERYKSEEDNYAGLQNDDLCDLHYDINQRIWIASRGSGFYIYDPNELNYKRITHELNREQSLGNNNGLSILEDHLGNIWYGTVRGISIYNPNKRHWRHIYNKPGEKELLQSNYIISMSQVSNNEIWISCFGGGVSIYRYSEDKVYPIERFYPELAKTDLKFVYKIFMDSNGNIWLGRGSNKTIKLNLKTMETIEFNIPQIQMLSELPDGSIYAANSNSLWLIKNNSSQASPAFYNLNIRKRLRFVSSINQYADSLLLIGTVGSGVFIFSKDKKLIRNINSENGLGDNLVSSILIINDEIWISASSGLSRINILENSIKNFNPNNGLMLTSFSNNIHLITRDGMIIFGGNQGFIQINPSKFQTKETSVILRFTDFKINNKSAVIGAEDSPLKASISVTDEVVLKYNQNSFSFESVGINFTHPSQNNFSWRLLNFNDEWSQYSSNNIATYTNIPRGKYVFQAKVITPAGNSDIREIAVQVMSPWWLHPLAISIYVILLAGVFYLAFYFYRMKDQEKRSKEKISFFVNIAHDLRTPLTLIQSPLNKIVHSNDLNENDKKYIEMAVRNASSINKYFSQLLDFQKSDLDKMKVKLSKNDIVNHIKEISNNFHPLLSDMNIDFKMLTEEPSIEFYYDAGIIEKIIFNLLSNAVKYSKPNGKIRIKIKIVNNNCIIEVSDTGIGIPDRQKKDIFKRFFRADNAIQSYKSGVGVGLMLVKQLVGLIGGSITFKSKENEGSVFILTLKIQYSLKGDTEKRNREDYVAVLQSDVTPEANINILLSDIHDDSANTRKLPKLLIAEDNPELMDFLRDSFRDDYFLLSARNGAEALELARKYDVSLIVSDIMMPIMDGRMLCSEIKNHIETCHIPLIFLTALSSEEYRKDGYEAGADAYISKPFDVNVLKSRIENLINSRRVLKEKFLRIDTPGSEIPFKNDVDEDFLEKSRKLMQDNINNPEFSIEEFSRGMNVSRSLLYRKIKSLTDLSPLEFITYSRLKVAAQYLRNGQQSVKEVAYNCGFSDPRYFSTIFKKHFKSTPTEFASIQDDNLVNEV